MTTYRYIGPMEDSFVSNKEWYIIKKLDTYALCKDTGSNYKQWFKLSNLIKIKG